MINRANIFHKGMTSESTSRQKAQMTGDEWQAAGSQDTHVHALTSQAQLGLVSNFILVPLSQGTLS